MTIPSEVTIRTQPIELSSTEAANRATSRLSTRVKRLYSDVETVQIERRFKPFHEFEAELRKAVPGRENVVYHGLIVVDAKTGIARPLLEEHVNTETRTVNEAELLTAELGEEQARRRAERQKMQTQARESGKIYLNKDGELVYKPLWLVELADGEVTVVDATNGRTYNDMTLG
jgi:mannose-6-phosphate isomerase class I